MSGARAESATGVIAIFTVNSYTVIPMRILYAPFRRWWHDDYFRFHDTRPYLGSPNRRSKRNSTSFPAYVTTNCEGIKSLTGNCPLPENSENYSNLFSETSSVPTGIQPNASVASHGSHKPTHRRVCRVRICLAALAATLALHYFGRLRGLPR
jgi:hypothetical protein